MRLFVALEIPEETREALAAVIAQLERAYPSARWVPPKAMHVTLKFIGNTSEEKLAAIRDELSKVRSTEPVEIRFRGLGFFPNEKRPRVFWCGAEASPNAAALAADMDRALGPLGIKSEARAFTPHLTLARFKESRGDKKQANRIAEIAKSSHEMQAKDFGALRTSEFHLFESKTKPSGAEYTRLETFHFDEATF